MGLEPSTTCYTRVCVCVRVRVHACMSVCTYCTYRHNSHSLTRETRLLSLPLSLPPSQILPSPPPPPLSQPSPSPPRVEGAKSLVSTATLTVPAPPPSPALSLSLPPSPSSLPVEESEPAPSRGRGEEEEEESPPGRQAQTLDRYFVVRHFHFQERNFSFSKAFYFIFEMQNF